LFFSLGNLSLNNHADLIGKIGMDIPAELLHIRQTTLHFITIATVLFGKGIRYMIKWTKNDNLKVVKLCWSPRQHHIKDCFLFIIRETKVKT